MMIVSKKKGGIFLLLLVALLVCVVVSMALMIIACKGVYLDFIGFVTSLFFLLFAVVIGIALSKIHKLVLSADTLEVYTLLGKKKKEIYLPSIDYWTTFEKKSKYSSWTELNIYSKSGKYQISSYVYENFEALNTVITKFAYRNRDKEKAVDLFNNKLYGFAAILIGTIALSLSGYFLFKKATNDLLPSQLNTVVSVLREDPYIKKGSKGAKTLEIELEDYPEFDFKISGATYAAIYAQDFVANVRKGDTVYVSLENGDYRKKIAKDLPLGFFDKTLFYRYINVIELKSKPYTYLNLEDYNVAHRNGANLPGALFCLVFGLIFEGLGVYMIVKNKS